MPEEHDEQIRRWIETWRRAGPALERIRRDELRAFRYAEKAALVDALLQMGCDLAVPRLTSGLVEQQRLFRKVRR